MPLVKTAILNFTDNISQKKRELRAMMLLRRDALMPLERERMSASITAQLLALPDYRQATTVMAYMSMGSEFSTLNFVQQVLLDGKRLVLPRVDKLTRSLALHEVADLHDLATGVWAISEPKPDAKICPLSEIDFILVPGLAFDRCGYRLGYGGGFYDRLFAKNMLTVTKTPASMRVSAAFSMQIIDAVPTTEEDQKVAVIITENEMMQI